MVADGSREERLQKTFLELQSHSSALVNFTFQWKELKEHFDELERLLQKRFEDLGQKGKENGKEKQSAAETSTGNPNETSEEKFTAVRNAGSPNKTPEKNSAAENSTGNPNESSEMESAAGKSAGNPNETLEKNSRGKESTENTKKASPALKHEVNPRPKLKTLCENMDGEGLRKFLVSAREVRAIRNEVPAALRCAADPTKLVLQTLDGFYPADNELKPPRSLDTQRYACDLLLEALPSVLSPDEVSSEAKKDALKIAAIWKSKMNPDASLIPDVKARAFLQFLASYGISKEFKDDDLCTLVLRISSYPEAPELCRALQISHKIPDFVENLSSGGKRIDAIRFVYAFGLVEKFPPVPLLKAYVEYARKVSKRLANKGKNTLRAKNYAASREIDLLKNAIKCIEEHKLESQISSKDLEERVDQLQKDKAKRKRSEEAIDKAKRKKSEEVTKSEIKMDCLSSGAGALLLKPSPPSAFSLSNSAALLHKPKSPSAFTLTNSSHLYRPAPVVSIPSYSLPGQGIYDRGSQGIYQTAYDVGSNPSSLSNSHLYPSDSLQSSLYGVGSFRGSTNYGSYNIGSGGPPGTSYQSLYLH
eukprot:PITA_14705